MAAKRTAEKKASGKKPSRAKKVPAPKPAAQVSEEQTAIVYAATPEAPRSASEVPPKTSEVPPKTSEAPPKTGAASPKASAAPSKNGASPPAYADFASVGRDNLAAVARANAVLVKGIEEFGQEVAACAEHSLVSAMDTARALVGIRTLADLLALNSKVAQATLEGAIANTARLSEIGLRVATETLGPLNERIALAFGRVGRPKK